MRTKYYLVFLPFYMIALLSGCHHSAMRGEKTNYGSLEPNFISIANGGGFTGRYSGFILTREGEVYSWEGAGRPDSVRFMFKTDDDSAAFFFRYLDEIHFSKLDYHSSGNMSSSIEAHSPDFTHKIEFSSDGDASVPPALPVFYSMLFDFIHRH